MSAEIDEQEVRRVYYNRPQLLADAVDAQHEVAIWARGTGKSDGRIAMRINRCIQAMPLSMGAMVARSYQQILTRTLPSTIRGLSRLGLVYERDFVVRQRGPKSWPLPLLVPLKWDTTVHFRNGCALALVSQQNAASANGLSIDWSVGDEAKYLKREQYEEEFLPAMRGNTDRFGHLSYHMSTLLTTDMPTTPTARWLLDREADMDKQVIEIILQHQLQVTQLRQALASGRLSQATERVYQSRIRKHLALLNDLRKGTTYFSMASALDNIDVLGQAYLARMKAKLPDYLFRTSILNLRPDRVEGGFYPGLGDHMEYTPDESSFVFNAGKDYLTGQAVYDDCRKDADLVPHVPIEIGPDFGASFNCVVVGQLFGDQFSILNQIYVKHPEKIEHLAEAFNRYYQWHQPKHVILHHDHTMIGEDGVRDHGFAEELRRQLERRGWDVSMNYIGQAHSHHTRYVFWARRCSDADPHLPRVRFNSLNTEPTLLSMRMAKAKQGKHGFEKDKTLEKNTNADQAEATHLSDACDLLVTARFLSLASPSDSGIGVHFG